MRALPGFNHRALEVPVLGPALVLVSARPTALGSTKLRQRSTSPGAAPSLKRSSSHAIRQPKRMTSAAHSRAAFGKSSCDCGDHTAASRTSLATSTASAAGSRLAGLRKKEGMGCAMRESGKWAESPTAHTGPECKGLGLTRHAHADSARRNVGGDDDSHLAVQRRPRDEIADRDGRSDRSHEGDLHTLECGLGRPTHPAQRA